MLSESFQSLLLILSRTLGHSGSQNIVNSTLATSEIRLSPVTLPALSCSVGRFRILLHLPDRQEYAPSFAVPHLS